MNKIRYYSVIAVFILVFTGCSRTQPEETTEHFESLVDKDTDMQKLPEGVGIVRDFADFTKVTEDQSFHLETDEGYGEVNGIQTDGTNIYYCSLDYIHVVDRETKVSTYLCNKPNCSHQISETEEEVCNAWLGEMALQYYNGALYSVKLESFGQGDQYLGEKLVLYRIELDGSGKEKVCELATLYDENIVDEEGGQGHNADYYWIIHRGYIYYVYRIGTSGLQDNSYYNNNSNYVSRMKLEKDAEREYLVPLTGNYTEQISFRAYGSYVYFYDVQKENKGIFYRFNTESGKLELPFEEERMIATYASQQDRILFMEDNGGTGLYQYSFEDGSISIVADIANYNESFGKYSGIFLRQDDRYIYVTSAVDNDWHTQCIILDSEGEYLGTFPLYQEGKDYSFSMDLAGDGLILLYDYYEFQYYYCNTDDLLQGIFNPVKIED